MPIKFKIGDDSPTQEQKAPQATIGLKISKTLDGNLLINDHQYVDIVIMPTEGRIVTMPKPYAEKDVYDYQKDLMYYLFKNGITDAMTPEGGAFIGMMETTYPLDSDVEVFNFLNPENPEEYDKNIEDNFVNPPDSETTKYGEIPPYQDTPGANAIGDPTYTFAGYGYLY